NGLAVSSLAFGETVPARRHQRVVRKLLDLAGDECGGSPVAPEPRCFLAVGIPDVERRAEYIPAGVVDEVATQVLAAEEDLDVARERENAGIGGNDAVSGLAASPRLTLHAVLGE